MDVNALSSEAELFEQHVRQTVWSIRIAGTVGGIAVIAFLANGYEPAAIVSGFLTAGYMIAKLATMLDR